MNHAKQYVQILKNGKRRFKMKGKKIFFVILIFIFISALPNTNSAELMNKNIIWQIEKDGTKIEYFTINDNFINQNNKPELNLNQNCLVKNNVDGTLEKSIDKGQTWHKFLKQKVKTLDFMIYPSLSNNIINIQFKDENQSEYSLKIFDYLGNDLNKMIHINYDQNYLDISKLSPGLYYLTIIMGNLPGKTLSFGKQ